MKIKAVFYLIILFYTSPLYSQSDYFVWMKKDNSYLIFKKIWADEFVGNTLNTAVWRTEFPWGKILLCNNEQQLYIPENVEVKDGLLQLTARKGEFKIRAYPQLSDSAILTSDCNYDGIQDTVGINLRTFQYTSGMVYSRPSFQYGYFESRFKIPSGKGLWPAFWLFGHKGEIDVCEFRCHEPDKVHFDVHQGETIADNGPVMNERPGGWLKLNKKADDQYIKMAVWWEPDKVTWFINDVPSAIEYHRFEYPMSLVANLAIPGNCPSLFCPGPDETTVFPSSFNVDYLRVYQPVDIQDTLVLRLDSFQQEYYSESLSDVVPVQHKKFLNRISADRQTNDPFVKIAFNAAYQSVYFHFLQKRTASFIRIQDYTGFTLSETKPSQQNEVLNISMLQEGSYLIEFEYRNGMYQVPFRISRSSNY